MCARACGHAHGPGAADEHGNLPPTPLPPSRFNPGNGRGLRELADTAHKKYGKTIKSMVQDSNRKAIKGLTSSGMMWGGNLKLDEWEKE